MNGFAVRTNSTPYFTFQSDVFATSEFPASKKLYLMVSFSLGSLPTQASSPSENHVILSLHDQALSFSAAEVGYLAVTPDGRAACGVNTGFTYQTVPGFLTPDGLYHKLELAYDGNAHNATVTFDGGVIQTGSDAGGTPLPVQLGQFSILNGLTGATRGTISVQQAMVGFGSGAVDPLVTWNINEGFGGTLNPTTTAGASAFTSAQLFANFYDSLFFGHPWGPVTVADPSAGFRWLLQTQWTRRPSPQTGWLRKAASFS